MHTYEHQCGRRWHGGQTNALPSPVLNPLNLEGLLVIHLHLHIRHTSLMSERANHLTSDQRLKKNLR